LAARAHQREGDDRREPGGRRAPPRREARGAGGVRDLPELPALHAPAGTGAAVAVRAAPRSGDAARAGVEAAGLPQEPASGRGSAPGEAGAREGLIPAAGAAPSWRIPAGSAAKCAIAACTPLPESSTPESRRPI